MSATIVHLVQGSSEWLEYRIKMRNASETAAVMGLSPWCTPYQLWLLKTGRAQAKANVAMAHGTSLEPAARATYESQTGNVMQPLVLRDGPYSASLDGINLDGDLIVEIKCPYQGRQSSLWKDVCAGQVPEHYKLQVQHQLLVSGAAFAHLWVFEGVNGALVEIYRDEAIIELIQRAWEAFQPFLTSDTPPPITEADTIVRDDDAWTRAANAYVRAKQAADIAEVDLAKAKESLLSLTHHPKEFGAGVSVTRFWKQGSVAYAKVPELQGIALDQYRGKPREEVRISMHH